MSSQSVAANITNCNVLTIEQFKSGEAAYLLNNENSSGVWGQDLTAQNYPVLGGSAVYKIRTGLCSADELIYSNTNGSVTHDPENAEFENGFCKNNCGYTQSAVLTTDKYDIDGDSNKDNVYEIANAGQLLWFSNKVNSGNLTINAVLTDNIIFNENLLSELITINDDLSATVNEGKNVKSWTPFGSRYKHYNGIFNGQGYIISGLYCNTPGNQYVGLFGVVAGKIKNVTVKDSYFSGYYYVGAIAGYGGAENCESIENVIKGSYNVGGISGMSLKGNILNCFNSSTVKGSVAVGGICGEQGKGSDVQDTPEISYCLNTGKIIGNTAIGAVCGETSEVIIRDCYYSSSSGTSAGIGRNGFDYSPSTIENVLQVSDEDLKSGKAAYLLQGTGEEIAWGQNIGSDAYPVLGGKKVYKYGNAYSNEKPIEFKISNPIIKDGKTEAEVSVPYIGKYTLIFAKYENNTLKSIITLQIETTKINSVIKPSADIELGAGDKIMLWDNFGNIIPLCNAYELK